MEDEDSGQREARETESWAVLPGQRVRAKIIGQQPWGVFAKIIGYEHVAEKIVTPKGGGHVVVPYMVHIPADVRAALHWLAIRRPKPWARVPEPPTDIANIIAERRKHVAQDSARQAAENAARFKAEVDAEVARRLA